MDFLTRRTIRKYKDTLIPEEVKNKILEVALVSPSACNRRPYEYITVTNKENLEALSKSKASGAAMIEKSPLAIVVIGDKNLSDVWAEDCSIAMTLMQLKAWELGVGSCWIQMKGRKDANGILSEDIIRDIFEIPEQYGILAVLSFGYPDEEKPAYTSKDMNFSKVHSEKF